MKKVYHNVVKFDEDYYTLPRKFEAEILKDIAKEYGDFKFWTNVVPQSTVNGVVVDLYNVLVGSHIVVQFETRYDKSKEELVIETVSGVDFVW